MNVDAGDADRRLQSLHDPSREAGCILRVGDGAREQDKLIPAKASNGVDRPYDTHEATRDLLEELIPCSVP